MLILEPSGWGVVIAGLWNRAILTPAGIAKLIYGLAQNENVQVEIPLDGIAGYRVKHPSKDVLTQVDTRLLRIAATKMNWTALEDSMRFGVAAIKRLPMTPLVAAGVNVNFRIPDPPPRFLEYADSTADAKLNELGYEISQREIHRKLILDAGVVNLKIAVGNDGYQISYNFHLAASDHTSLAAWLEMPIERITKFVRNTLNELGVPWNEGEDDNE